MSANDTQVGGTHYQQDVKDKPQHWDLAIMYRWDAFQYQITKYVMRWKDKHSTPEKRLEDLKKARHFLDKYIENFEKYDTKGYVGLMFGDAVMGRADSDMQAGELVRPTPTKSLDQAIQDFDWSNRLAEQRLRTPGGAVQGGADYGTPIDGVTFTQFEQQSPAYLHDAYFTCEGGYGNGMNLYRCRACRAYLNAAGLSEAARAHACGGGSLGVAPQRPEGV